MNRIIGVTELKRRFRSVFDDVVLHHTPYVLTRGSRPEAVLIPYDQYVKFAQADEAGIIQRFQTVVEHMNAANARYSEAEVEADLRAAQKTIRKRNK